MASDVAHLHRPPGMRWMRWGIAFTLIVLVSFVAASEDPFGHCDLESDDYYAVLGLTRYTRTRVHVHASFLSSRMPTYADVLRSMVCLESAYTNIPR